MKVYFLKRRGKNWWGNTACLQSLQIGNGEKIPTDILFYRKKDAKEYLESFAVKFGNPFVIWSAEMKEDKTDNRIYRK